MKVITIIPARANSKRLKHKNTLNLDGIPLISHSINYAKKNQQITNHIYVSTDSAAVRDIALARGVKTISRPTDLASDTASTVSVLKHALQRVNEKYDVVILLQPTNPLRPKNLLKDAFAMFKKANSDSLMTVSTNHKKLGKISNGRFIPYTYKMGQRSQDIEPLYYENGLLYISKVGLILKDTILGKKNTPIIIDHPYANVDIDTAEDFKFAQYILKNYPNE
tara:strand:+ start:250 stop:918 length:669 start_codon:yes stop_codon:yes gene_type:complete